MRRTASVVLSVLIVILGTLAGPAYARPETSKNGSGLGIYVGEISPRQLEKLGELGLSREDIAIRGTRDRRVSVEVIISARQARELRSQGIDLKVKKVGGDNAVQLLAKQARQGYEVFRPYSGAGGLREEIVQAANDHPEIAKPVKIGESVQGTDILAVKVTKDARELPDGERPAVLYAANQHAREWITPEMTRRLLHYFLDTYGHDREITRIVDTTELWFLVSANPDGYDWTFEPGQRLWRKNLRDNDGDGEITAAADGVDLNRNLRYRWGYDNEGSSSDPGNQTFRGASPMSEPETQALDGLLRRIGFEYMINYHSAAELLLYGTGWQVATPNPDDAVYEALLGDDENPAVPGYDPDISAELYTTNGETTEHAHNVHGTLAVTPEMSECQTVAASDPNDEWDPNDPEDCPSIFVFPDDEQLVQAEFEKNIPLAVAVAKSAHDPDDPASPVGRSAPDFQVDEFSVSYGGPQPVAVVARRSLKAKKLRYRVNGGRQHTAQVREWGGGERYGDEGDVYYAEYRGTVRRAGPGDEVEVWFTAAKPGAGTVESRHFTFTVADTPDARVLVVANEDYKGVNPDYPDGVTEPKYANAYVRALAANDIGAAVWDVTDQGVPHHLGVLEHFDAVVWYLGDNRLTQDPEDEITEVFGDGVRDAAVAERQQYLTLAVRDYLNNGGKVLHSGETAAYFGSFGGIGGVWYGLDGHPEEDCVITEAADDCLIVADDFSQYYLGAFNRVAVPNPDGITGTGSPFDGAEAAFGGAADNPLDEAGDFQVTSDTLPVDQFPQFRSAEAGEYQGVTGPFEPTEGQWYAGGLHRDASYMRLLRTVDLSQVSAADEPSLEFALSYDTESGYDNVIIEAHTAGADDWTTLPDANGGTDSTVPTACSAGFLMAMHPFLEHYLTSGDPCQATGMTGDWHRFTGSSGWREVAVDLSAYAGEEIEVAVSYVTDPGAGGTGVFVDDTRLVVGGETVEAEGFESGLGTWSTPGPPAGSPAGGGAFDRSQALVDSAAAVATDDSVILGFGLEQVATREERTDLMGRVMGHLLGSAAG